MFGRKKSSSYETIVKVYEALEMAGLSDEQAFQAVKNIQSKDIKFKEKKRAKTRKQ